MPTTLSEASSFDAATAPIGTDIRNAASVQTALQAQTNRTRFVFDRTTPLADIAALKAIASPADGLVRLVEQFGFYIFDSSSGLAESLPWVVQPTTGTGRWLHSLFSIEGNANGLANLDGSARVPLAQLPAGTASGLATLDGSSKLVQAQTRNGIIAVNEARITVSATTTSTTFVDMTGLSVSFTAVAGDRLVIDAALLASQSGTGGFVKVVVNDGGADTDVGAAITPTTSTVLATLQAVHTVVTTGTVTARIRGLVTTGTLTIVGNASAANGQSRIRAMQIRP